MPKCLCGCGADVPGLFVKGHHWKLLRERGGVPDEKVCERCGRTYARTENAHRQSNKHWVGRRFCDRACQESFLADMGRELRGDKHPHWKGDDATPAAGRRRARSIHVDKQPCRVCGEPAERHHKDGNTRNNAAENIDWLCRLHHIRAEDRMAYRRGKPGQKLGPRDPDLLAAVQRLRATGMAYPAIAAELECPVWKVGDLIRRHG